MSTVTHTGEFTDSADLIDLRYSPDSVRAVDLVRDRARVLLNQLATERAISDGRKVVTADDVLNSIAGALREIIDEVDPREGDH